MDLVKAVIAAWVIVSLVGCTSMQPLPGDPVQYRYSMHRHVTPGRDVRMTTAGGSIHEFRVRALTNDHVSGRSFDGTEHQVEIATITKLETLQFDRARTIALGATVGAILLTVLVVGWLGRQDR